MAGAARLSNLKCLRIEKPRVRVPRIARLAIDIRTKIGRYEICSQLGAGGMGEVYLAHDTKLDRKVALKILPGELGSRDRLRRFVQEARAASALNHPNILTIYEIDEVNSAQFIATEFIEGQTLRARMKAVPLHTIEAIDISIQVASALDAAHRVGIVHRDIKPENIMLRRDGIVKVLDFGIAKLTLPRTTAHTDGEAPTLAQVNTETGMILGTTHYMSPEQARGLDVDARTDIWSLGCVLYEMVTDRRPFSGPTPLDIMTGILSREPDSIVTHAPERPEELERIVSRALRKDRSERYQAVAKLLSDLKELKSELDLQIKRSSSERNVFSLSPLAGPHAASVPEKSVAVLYFENMSPGSDSDYFCAGITEDIITDLSKIRDLKVVSRTDVLPFRNKQVNTRQVGEALHVNYILEGSVRTAGNKIRISAQLVNVRDGYHLWAERFDRLLEDIFDVQNEVSQKIAEALKISLTTSEKELLARKPTDDLKAYDFYLRGRELLYQKGKRNTEHAILMFENALEIDPNFASSYAGLAEAYTYMYEWYDGNPLWLGKAIETDQKALALDPSSFEAQFGMAMVYFHQRRFAESKRTIEGILKQDSEFFPGYLRLGMIAEQSGELDNALNYYRRAAELKPQDEDPWRFLAGVQRKLGNAEAAEEAALRVVEVTSRKLEASLEDIIVMSRLAEAYARFGGREEAHATLRRVFELEPNDGLAVYNCSCAYALLGEKRAALLSLRRAFENGFRTVAHWARTDTAFDNLRTDVEFEQLVAELQ
jgi:serine/threonine protein kinase/cytochrome c-type biogenesis protein CcmH/NrfG